MSKGSRSGNAQTGGDLSSEEEEEDDIVNMVGLKKKKKADCFEYEMCEVYGHAFHTGQSAFFRAGEGEPPYIGTIVRMYTNKKGKKLCEVWWHYQDYDLRDAGRPRTSYLRTIAGVRRPVFENLPNEVFLSSHFDEDIALGSLDAPCTVVYVKSGGVPVPDPAASAVKFCRYFFDHKTSVLLPLDFALLRNMYIGDRKAIEALDMAQKCMEEDGQDLPPRPPVPKGSKVMRVAVNFGLEGYKLPQGRRRGNGDKPEPLPQDSEPGGQSSCSSSSSPPSSEDSFSKEEESKQKGGKKKALEELADKNKEKKERLKPTTSSLESSSSLACTDSDTSSSMYSSSSSEEELRFSPPPKGEIKGMVVFKKNAKRVRGSGTATAGVSKARDSSGGRGRIGGKTKGRGRGRSKNKGRGKNKTTAAGPGGRGREACGGRGAKSKEEAQSVVSEQPPQVEVTMKETKRGEEAGEGVEISSRPKSNGVAIGSSKRTFSTAIEATQVTAASSLSEDNGFMSMLYGGIDAEGPNSADKGRSSVRGTLSKLNRQRKSGTCDLLSDNKEKQKGAWLFSAGGAGKMETKTTTKATAKTKKKKGLIVDEQEEQVNQKQAESSASPTRATAAVACGRRTAALAPKRRRVQAPPAVQKDTQKEEKKNVPECKTTQTSKARSDKAVAGESKPAMVEAKTSAKESTTPANQDKAKVGRQTAAAKENKSKHLAKKKTQKKKKEGEEKGTDSREAETTQTKQKGDEKAQETRGKAKRRGGSAATVLHPGEERHKVKPAEQPKVAVQAAKKADSADRLSGIMNGMMHKKQLSETTADEPEEQLPAVHLWERAHLERDFAAMWHERVQGIRYIKNLEQHVSSLQQSLGQMQLQQIGLERELVQVKKELQFVYDNNHISAYYPAAGVSKHFRKSASSSSSASSGSTGMDSGTATGQLQYQGKREGKEWDGSGTAERPATPRISGSPPGTGQRRGRSHSPSASRPPPRRQGTPSSGGGSHGESSSPSSPVRLRRRYSSSFSPSPGSGGGGGCRSLSRGRSSSPSPSPQSFAISSVSTPKRPHDKSPPSIAYHSYSGRHGSYHNYHNNRTARGRPRGREHHGPGQYGRGRERRREREPWRTREGKDSPLSVYGYPSHYHRNNTSRTPPHSGMGNGTRQHYWPTPEAAGGGPYGEHHRQQRDYPYRHHQNERGGAQVNGRRPGKRYHSHLCASSYVSSPGGGKKPRNRQQHSVSPHGHAGGIDSNSRLRDFFDQMDKKAGHGPNKGGSRELSGHPHIQQQQQQQQYRPLRLQQYRQYYGLPPGVLDPAMMAAITNTSGSFIQQQPALSPVSSLGALPGTTVSASETPLAEPGAVRVDCEDMVTSSSPKTLDQEVALLSQVNEAGRSAEAVASPTIGPSAEEVGSLTALGTSATAKPKTESPVNSSKTPSSARGTRDSKAATVAKPVEPTAQKSPVKRPPLAPRPPAPTKMTEHEHLPPVRNTTKATAADTIVPLEDGVGTTSDKGQLKQPISAAVSGSQQEQKRPEKQHSAASARGSLPASIASAGEPGENLCGTGKSAAVASGLSIEEPAGKDKQPPRHKGGSNIQDPVPLMEIDLASLMRQVADEQIAKAQKGVL